jgi:hypothetical protein
MTSPQTSNFQTSTADTEAAIQELKTNVVATMKEKIEKETGAKDIRFTFRKLTEPLPSLVMNILWEARADF